MMELGWFLFIGLLFFLVGVVAGHKSLEHRLLISARSNNEVEIAGVKYNITRKSKLTVVK